MQDTSRYFTFIQEMFIFILETKVVIKSYFEEVLETGYKYDENEGTEKTK